MPLENAAEIASPTATLALREPQVHAIDFPALTVERSHFVQPDYGHVALDLLLKAPFQVGAGDQLRTLFIYLLLEHQSNRRAFSSCGWPSISWKCTRCRSGPGMSTSSDSLFSLQPVLPVVLYTGERRWVLWGLTFALQEVWTEQFERRLVILWMTIVAVTGLYAALECLTGIDIVKRRRRIPSRRHLESHRLVFGVADLRLQLWRGILRPAQTGLRQNQ